MIKKKNLFTMFIATLAIIMTLGMLGACGNDDSDEVFRIGNFLPLSGGLAAFGIEGRNALELAVELINEEGGFNGVPVELIVYDVSTPVDAVSTVNRLIELHDIDALIASVTSSEILAIGPIANENSIITFGGGTSPTWMEPDWPFLFRAAMNTDVAMVLTAEMVREMGATRAAIFHGLDDSSIASADTFAVEAEARGISIVTREAHAAGDVDFSAQIANIFASDPHVVFFGTLGADTINFVDQLRTLGWTGVVINNEAFAHFMIDAVGVENSNYVFFTNPYVTYTTPEEASAIPAMQRFLELYFERWGEMPATEIPYRTWDSITSLWEAAKLAPDNSPESLRQAANRVVFDGLGGTIDFTDGSREGYQFFNRFVIINGEYVLFDDWLAAGGLQTFFQNTGHSFD